jgi:hypothetical protein
MCHLQEASGDASNKPAEACSGNLLKPVQWLQNEVMLTFHPVGEITPLCSLPLGSSSALYLRADVLSVDSR